MRKLMLSLVFVLGTGTMVNATTGVEKTSIITPIEVAVEDVGCASNCVKTAKTLVRFACAVLGEDPNDHIDDFFDIYLDCYEDNCE